MSRANPIASVFKRFLSRESNGSDNTSLDKVSTGPRLFRSTSLAPDVLPPKVKLPIGGSMRITDQIIEEVDEQLTISQITQSQRGDQPNRPTVKDVFGEVDDASNNVPPVIPISSSRPIYSRSQSSISGVSSLFPQVGVDALSNNTIRAEKDNFSRLTGKLIKIRLKVGLIFYISPFPVEENNDNDDDFERLRKTREKERQQRTQFKLARSISTHPGNNLDGESNTNQLFSTEALIPSLFKGCYDDNCPPPTEENRNSIVSGITTDNSEIIS